MKEQLETIEQFKDLEENWDSYGASPIKHESIDIAKKIIKRLHSLNLPMPDVFPTPSGNVQIEWSQCGLDLEIEIDEGYLFGYIDFLEE